MGFNRNIRTRFDCLRENTQIDADMSQRRNYKGNITNKIFKVNDRVYTRDYSKPNKKG